MLPFASQEKIKPIVRGSLKQPSSVQQASQENERTNFRTRIRPRQSPRQRRLLTSRQKDSHSPSAVPSTTSHSRTRTRTRTRQEDSSFVSTAKASGKSTPSSTSYSPARSKLFTAVGGGTPSWGEKLNHSDLGDGRRGMFAMPITCSNDRAATNHIDDRSISFRRYFSGISAKLGRTSPESGL